MLVLVGLARFGPALFAPEPIEDEVVYFSAFESARHGDSPYVDGFFYSPGFAALGAGLEESLGRGRTLGLIRGLNLAGLAILVWLALAFLDVGVWSRLLVGAAFIALAPAVRLAMAWGNLSPLVIALLLLALTFWLDRPVLAGLALGLSLAIKPIGPLALLVLLAHRGPARRAATLSCVIAALVASSAYLSPFLADFLALGSGFPNRGRSAGLQQVLAGFGLEVGSSWLALIVAVLAIFLARRFFWSRLALLNFAGVMALLATPLVWSHTLLLVLPLQVMALSCALRRDKQPNELILVLSLILAIQLCEGLGGVETWSAPWRGFFVAIPALAPALLAFYVARNNESC